MAKRRGQSKAFMARIRKLRGHRKINKSGSVSLPMARRRSYARYSKRRYSHHSKRAFGGEVGGLAIGTGVYLLYQAFGRPAIESAVPSLTGAMPIVETVGGYMLAKSGRGILKDTGKALFVFGLFQLGANYILPMISGGTSSSSFASVPLN
jgi:hypothetical protein